MTVIDEIAAERRRQIEEEGFTAEHDDDVNDDGEIAKAAACFCLKKIGVGGKAIWPWTLDWWKPKDRRRDLIKAGALIVAEIERLDRASPPPDTGG